MLLLLNKQKELKLRFEQEPQTVKDGGRVCLLTAVFPALGTAPGWGRRLRVLSKTHSRDKRHTLREEKRGRQMFMN